MFISFFFWKKACLFLYALFPCLLATYNGLSAIGPYFLLHWSVRTDTIKTFSMSGGHLISLCVQVGETVKWLDLLSFLLSDHLAEFQLFWFGLFDNPACCLYWNLGWSSWSGLLRNAPGLRSVSSLVLSLWVSTQLKKSMKTDGYQL